MSEQKENVYLSFAVLRGNIKYKIGRTWNLDLRMAQLSRQKKAKVRAIYIIKVESVYDAMALEGKIHRKIRSELNPKNKLSEWYDANARIVEIFHEAVL